MKAIVLDPGFRQGEATTSYVEEFLSRAPKDVFKNSLGEYYMTKKKTNSESDDSIPTFSEESGSLGTIRINHSVVAGIVRLATQSVKGVINVGELEWLKDLLIFLLKKSERGVSVSENEDGTYKIEVRVVLRFGVDLAKTGSLIQSQFAIKFFP